MATAGGVAVAGNGNTVIVGATGTPVGREVALHWQQVSDRYRIDDLLDRDAERDELTEFLTHVGKGWWGWHGAAWSGKTRLMVEVACAPPAGWRPVAFFVRRGNGDNTQAGFVRSAIPQLALIAGMDQVELGDQHDPRAQVALFHELLEAAVAACDSNGEKLLLLIDGLDEDDTSADDQLRSVLDPLPFTPDRYVVVVSSRPSPQLRLPDHHPLKSSAPWRTLKPVEAAVAAERTAREDMAALLKDPIGRDVASFLEAAGYPLPARALASLTKKPLSDIARIFDRSSGRSFTPIPSAASGEPGYVFGHVTLQQMLIQDLNPDAPDPSSNDERLRAAWAAARAAALAPWKARVQEWGQLWAERQWPVETPDYLLEDGFLRLLDDEKLVDVLTDTQRHARIQARFGSLAPALAQLRVHLGQFFPAWTLGHPDPPQIDLERVGRLLFAVHDLTRGGGRVPSLLPAVFVRVSDPRTAEQLIEASEDPLEALASVAVAYREVGDPGAGMQAVDRFVERLGSAAAPSQAAADWCARLATLCAEVGDLDRAATVAHAIGVTAGTHQNIVGAVVVALAAAGEVEPAMQLAEALEWRERFRAFQDAAWTCHHVGASEAAPRFADAAFELVDKLGVVKHDYAIAVVRLYADLAETGRARTVAGEFAGRIGLAALVAVAETYVDRGEVGPGRALAIEAAQVADRLSHEEPFFHRELPALAAVLVKTGAEQEALHVLDSCGRDMDRAGHAILVEAYYAAARPDRAREHLSQALTEDTDGAPWIRIHELETLIGSVLAAAPSGAVDEVVAEFTASVRKAIDDSWVRHAAVRAAIRLARHGRLRDSLTLLDEVRRTRDRLVDEATVAAAHALARGPQWAGTYELLKVGEPSVRELAGVADTLARNDHVTLAREVATAALAPEETALPLVESLTEVAYALGHVGDLETAVTVAAEGPAWSRFGSYFWAADAASKQDPAGILGRIEALNSDALPRAALLAGGANGALTQARRDDAAELLARAADTIRTQSGAEASTVVSDIAGLLAHVSGTATASIELIADVVPADQQHGPLARVAGVLKNSGKADEAGVAASMALASARNVVDERQRAHVLASLVIALVEAQLLHVARTAADDAYALFETSIPATASLEGYALSSFSHTASSVAEAQALTGRLDRTMELCEQVRFHGGQPDSHRLVPALAVGGHTTAARELLAQIPVHNQEQPLERMVAALADADRIDEAMACLEDIPQPGPRSGALNLIASHQAREGRTDDAQRFAKQAIEEAERADTDVRPEQLLNAAQTLMLIGATEQARDTATAAIRHAAGRQSFRFSDLAVGCAQLLQRTEDTAVSRRLLAEAWRADGNPFKGWPLLADLDSPAALALARRRWPAHGGPLPSRGPSL